MFQSKLANFALQIFLYNKMLMIRRNVTVEGISSCVFAIASVLFSNYYENRIDAMANTKHNNVILFQVFLRIIEKLISRWGGGGRGGGVLTRA